MKLSRYNFIGIAEVALIILFLISFDQCTKVFISKIMLKNNFENIGLFPFLNLVFVRNTGVSFGMFSEGGIIGRYFFSIFSLVVGSLLGLLAVISEKRLISLSLGFISSGAIGNAIDRIYFGGVIDFIDFFIYNFHWPAFNFADIFITLGVVLLLIDNLFYKIK
jgi:signal peptidase II